MIASIRVMMLVFALAVALPAEAAKRVALVFSDEKYEQLRPLSNPDNDARAVARALEAIGFEVTLETDRNLKRMRRAIEDFRDDFAGADVAVIYFAGHGTEIAGENRLLPVDADASSLDSLRATSLPLEEVRAAAASVAPVAVLLIDACRNDPFGASGGGGRSAKALGNDVGARVQPGFGRVGRAENTLFAFAAAPGATASDGEDGNSPFSAALARYLPTDGLEIRSVLTLVQQEVYERTHAAQLPYVENGLPRLFFAGQKGELPERERLLLAMADVTPQLRDEVERVASDRDMPLAPLYAALISADLKDLSADERNQRLAEAADAFVQTRDELQKLSSDDPQVARLRAEASEQLALGAIGTARERLTEAADIDARSRGALKKNYVARTLSEMDTHRIAAGAARAASDYAAAVASLTTATSLYSEIEDDDIDERHRQDALWMLSDLGDLHRITGKSEAALQDYRAMTRAAELRARLFPDSADAEPDRSAAHSREGNALRILGRLDEAMTAYRTALEIARAYADRHHDSTDAQNNLAVAWSKIGDALSDGTDLTGAIAAYRNDAAIMLKLVDVHAGDAELERNLAISLERLASALAVNRNEAQARDANETAVETRRRLVAADPENQEDQRGLSISLGNLSERLQAAGDLQSAFDAADESLSIARALVAEDAGNVILARELALALTRQARVLRAAGETADARETYDEATKIFDELTAGDPGNAVLARDASVSLSQYVDLLLETGDKAAAAEALDKVVAAREALSAADPGNANLARDLSLALMRKVDLLAAAGNQKQAGETMKRALAIAVRLAEADPNNPQWQRDLSVAEIKSGDRALAQGDRSAAGKAYREALKIRKSLAAADPSDNGAARDLLIVHTRLAAAGVDVKANLRAALAIAERLSAAGALSSAEANMPDILRRQLAKAGG